ncbi:MAG TPA: 50S ribosomal protein L13 [Thermodesulfovibrio thiophilus]|uniref:50S ribosomal protein L13 n=1 Tax=Thermodesulfovibrio thiophilus TaxID=340095 RepID=UPI0004241807|nr:50S ribosomal protein L13 [Thermodesulfovibrio thiophilus]HHW19789.1 50S ribosomal protein L13 [Thermodesulfovibrio thiophilus]HOA83507.1 50S ribosomal protein L13 [Thermodesulfovibrio thiophilus]HQA04566.1 50S ribosomal protein L13 [Thermodesulfovibrio thiophilus]HQD36645.1 50S ribosomal protein L13 [Thermodesulfovibrio thiophilus]
MRTAFVKKEEVDRKWYVFDADGQTLGRFASRIAKILMGKNKPTYTPNVDDGDFVVVINAEKVKITGKKLTDKVYYHHTGYIGSLKSETLKDRLAKEPEEVIVDAVWGMLPKTRLGRKMIKKLKVYRGSEHPHKAQKPEPLKIS